MGVSFSKLNVKMNTETKSFEFNDNTVNVKQYLSAAKKVKIIQDCMNFAMSSNDDYLIEPLHAHVYATVYLVMEYTDIIFTAKQKENLFDLYDKIKSSGLLDKILMTIPSKEIEEFIEASSRAMDIWQHFHFSLYGVLENLKQDYADLNLDSDEIKDKLTNPESLGLLKSIMEELG